MLYGLDSLYVSYFFNTKASLIDWDDLAYQKELAKSEGRGEGREVRLGCERFLLMPFGSKPYTYVLKNREFTVKLAENMNPSCYVQYSAEGLWLNGPDKQLNKFETWTLSVNASPKRPATVARADWAFDFALPHVDFDQDSFVSRANKDSLYRADGKPQTFTFGAGDKVVRIYDKSAEVEESSGKTWFFQLWGRQKDVWRIEFQVRGEGLKEAGIKSLSDLFVRNTGLLRDLATKHTTLRSKTRDPNRSRWPLHPLWQNLVKSIENLPHQVRAESVDLRATVLARLYDHERSLYGNLKGLGALLSILEKTDKPLTLEETVARLRMDLMLREHQPCEWEADIDRRRMLHQLGEW